MIALLILTIIITPTQADLDELGAILCGEACGMQLQAQRFIGRQLRFDWYRLGTHGMARRWYGHKPNKVAVELMEQVFDEPLPTEWCRLVGNIHDVPHWREHGYLAPDAVPDHHWEHRGMEISAFDCVPREVEVKRWVECLGKECPR